MVLAIAGTLIVFYPRTLLTMEGDSFFLFTEGYMQQKLSMVPALNSLCTDCLLQFFRWPWVGAVIIALVLGSIMLFVAMIMHRLGWKRYAWASFLVPLLLFICYPLCLGLHLEVLALVMGLWLYTLIRPWWGRLACSLIMAVVGILLMSWPLLILMLALCVLADGWVLSRRRWMVAVLALMLAVIMPAIYSQRISYIPLTDRYMHMSNLPSDFEKSHLLSDQLKVNEQINSYVHLASEGKWQEMKSKVFADGNARSEIGMAYALLAESAMGTLPDNLLSYNINDSEKFFFRGVRDIWSCQFNRLFYDNLAVYDEAFHHAQEYFLLQRNGCCFSSLTRMVDYAVLEGDYPVARKYLKVLDKALLYHDFVQEQSARIAKLEKEGKGSEALARDDNFVGGYPFNSEMIRLIEHHVADEDKALDYLLCSLLLQKNLPNFRVVLSHFPKYRDVKTLPAIYADALQIMASGGNNPEQSGVVGTYSYYFYNISIPELNNSMLRSTGH